MLNVINDFRNLENQVVKKYETIRIKLHIFPPNSCQLDVLINSILTVFQFSESLKQFAIYSGKDTEDLYAAETEVFELNEFEKAKNYFFEKLDLLKT